MYLNVKILDSDLMSESYDGRWTYELIINGLRSVFGDAQYIENLNVWFTNKEFDLDFVNDKLKGFEVEAADVFKILYRKYKNHVSDLINESYTCDCPEFARILNDSFIYFKTKYEELDS